MTIDWHFAGNPEGRDIHTCWTDDRSHLVIVFYSKKLDRWKVTITPDPLRVSKQDLPYVLVEGRDEAFQVGAHLLEQQFFPEGYEILIREKD